MKKFIAVSMIALLAVTSVFAGFSGSASAGLIADIDNGVYGFTGASGAFTLSFDANTLAGEKAGEGEVYAEIGATATLSTDEIKDQPFGYEEPVAFTAAVSLDKLNIIGQNWSLDLLNVQDAANFAADSFKAGGKAANLDFGLDKTNGVTLSIYDYVVGLGFVYDKAAGASALLSFNTKTFDFDGFTVEAGIGAAKAAAKEVVGMDVSAKFGYTVDKFNIGVGTDVVLNIPTAEGSDFGVDADVALNTKYDFFTLDAYYATNAVEGNAKTYGGENYYTVGLGFDFKDVFAPLTLDVDVINVKGDTGKIAAATSFTFEGGSVSANGGYDFKSSKWNVGAKADYTIEKVGKLAGHVDVKSSAEELLVGVSLENTTLINNATLAFGYESGNLLAEEIKIGAITANVTVAF